MRPALRRASVAVVAFAVSACAAAEGVRPESGTTGPTTTTSVLVETTAAPPTKYGGTVVVAIGDAGAPRTLNPFLDGADAAVLDAIGPAMFARGFDVDPGTLALIPNVLASIPSPDDGTVFPLGGGMIEVTATVAPGAEWSDGVPITGADLAFTIEIASDPTLPIRADLAKRYSSIESDSIEVRGHSVTFRMRASTDYELLFDQIIPRHQVDGTDFVGAWNSQPWVGSGPFRFSSWTPGQLLELTRNENYWRTDTDGGPLPYLDRVIFRFYEPGPTLDPRLGEGLSAGQLDVVALGDLAAAEQELAPLDGVALESVPGLDWLYLDFQFGPANRNPRSLNRELRFRRAVASAIDRNVLAEPPATVPLLSMLSRYGSGYPATPWAAFPYDLGTTSSLLAALGTDLGVDLGSGSGPPMVITVPSDDPLVAAVAGEVVTMLRQAGFDARLQLEEPGDFYGATTDNGTWDVSIGRFTGGPGVGRAVDLMEIFDPDGLPFVGDNYFRWGTIDSGVTGHQVDAYRALADEMRIDYVPGTARLAVVDAEAILADQMVIIPLMTAGAPGLAYRAAAVAGPSPNPAEGVAWNIAEWTRSVGAGDGSAP